MTKSKGKSDKSKDGAKSKEKPVAKKPVKPTSVTKKGSGVKPSSQKASSKGKSVKSSNGKSVASKPNSTRGGQTINKASGMPKKDNQQKNVDSKNAKSSPVSKEVMKPQPQKKKKETKEEANKSKSTNNEQAKSFDPTNWNEPNEQEQCPTDDGQIAVDEEELNQVEQVQLEFTKPTINQMVEVKAEVPMGYDEQIYRVEFEALYDVVKKVEEGVQTIRMSYGSYIQSMVNLYTRRQKRKQQQSKPPNEINFLTTLSEISKKQAKELESCLENSDKFDIERFMNPGTREETFNALFEECAQLSAKTLQIRTLFFDSKGNFMREEYDSATEHKVDRKRFNHYRQWGMKLSAVIEEVTFTYNDNVLNMFRTH